MRSSTSSSLPSLAVFLLLACAADDALDSQDATSDSSGRATTRDDDADADSASSADAESTDSTGASTSPPDGPEGTDSTSSGAQTAEGSDSSTGGSARVEVHIHFDDLEGGTPVRDQYGDVVTFDDGSGTAYSALGLATSPPYYLCCSSSVGLDFARPVSDLTVFMTGANNSGVASIARVFTSDGTYEVELVGTGSYSDQIPIDLTEFEEVTRLELQSNDPFGVGWDDFRFTTTAREGR